MTSGDFLSRGKRFLGILFRKSPLITRTFKFILTKILAKNKISRPNFFSQKMTKNVEKSGIFSKIWENFWSFLAKKVILRPRRAVLMGANDFSSKIDPVQLLFKLLQQNLAQDFQKNGPNLAQNPTYFIRDFVQNGPFWAFLDNLSK